MMRRTGVLICAAALAVFSAPGADAALTAGNPEIQSAGPLAFGPDGVLFMGDQKSATVVALGTGDTTAAAARPINIEGINEKIAALLGTNAREIRIIDLAVNPVNGNAYISATRGSGSSAIPVLLRVDSDGNIEDVSLSDIAHDKAALPNAPSSEGASARRGRQAEVFTDIAFVDGQVFVAGLSNEEFSSKLRSISYPFDGVDGGTSVEIYHAAHGRWETNSPVRTFVPYEVMNEPHLLAAYTCTPLVRFPIGDLKPGTKIVGETIAELGNRNRPLDMIVYAKDGQDYILLTNSSRGVMKIRADEQLGAQEPLTDRVGGGGTAGVGYESIDSLKGVQQLDKLDDGHALIIVQAEDGAMSLKTIALP